MVWTWILKIFNDKIYRSESSYTENNLIKSINEGPNPFTELELGFKYFKDQKDQVPKKDYLLISCVRLKNGEMLHFNFK